MAERLNYAKAFPEGIHAVLNVEKAIRSSGLEPSLLELVKIRASQLNGCAYCLDMHTKDARAAGETEQRLYTLPAWRGNAVLYPTRARSTGLDGGCNQYSRGARFR